MWELGLMCWGGGDRRTDRQDMMALISGYLDLEFTMVESVCPSTPRETCAIEA